MHSYDPDNNNTMMFQSVSSQDGQTPRNHRKRRRSESSNSSRASRSCYYAVPLSVLLCAFTAHPSYSFSSSTTSTSIPRRDTELGLVSTAAEEATSTASKKSAQARKTLEQLFQEDYPTPLKTSSASYPPWLERYFDEPDDDLPAVAYSQLKDLRTLLTRNGFSADDIQEILQTMLYYHTPNSASLLLGMIDLVNLIVAEHSHFQTDYPECSSPMHCNVFASKPVILAGIVHYAECVAVRQAGIGSIPMDRSPLPTLLGGSGIHGDLPQVEALTFTNDFTWEPTTSKPTHSSRFPPNLPAAARKIAAHAATIKRSELLARTIMGVGSTRRLSKTEAESLQGLLLSNMEDWRALALRCIASLFRLDGILHQQTKYAEEEDSTLASDSLLPGLRSPEVVHTAQEAILVYGTLAERLGMHQLKAKIEEKAFQILYRRQYRAVSTVYQQSGKAMEVVRSYLSKQMDTLLRSDESLMAHIDTLEVSSRVKEPYSFWKKLLKTKAKEKSGFSLPSSADSKGQALSFMEVKDGIALRVILKARKESPDETEETTRAREKLLCYYVQHLIRKQWPGDDERLKDYIQHPKPNGYQSLHYTAFLKQFPFEVQVRSEEMHRIAEYGVAAHWDYKLAAAGTSQSGADISLDDQVGQAKAMFALKAAEDADADDTVVDVSVDAEEPEVVVDPLPEDGVLKASPTPLNGNAIAPLSSSGMINREVAGQHSSSASSAVDQKGNQSKNQVNYIDALVTARENLVQERVYVFVAGSSALTMDQGQLLILDSGSSIRDALDYLKENSPEVLQLAHDEACIDVGTNASVHRSSQKTAKDVEPSVLRNGQKAEMDDVIRNGDVLLLGL